VADFFAMGGYGAFVWTAYGITALALVLMFVWSWHGAKRRDAAFEQLKRLQRADRQGPASATLRPAENAASPSAANAPMAGAGGALGD
jgi:heme exporter protein D